MKCRECKLMQRMENAEDQENFSRIEDFHYVMDGCKFSVMSIILLHGNTPWGIQLFYNL